MSYEGFEQYLCANGHYRTYDAYYEKDLNNPLDVCSCGAMFIWSNGVDQTNGGDQGMIPISKFPIISVAVFETCEHCGHSEVKEEARYGIPSYDLREYE